MSGRIPPYFRLLSMLAGILIATAPAQSETGSGATYRLESAAAHSSVVSTFTLAVAPLDKGRRWVSLSATKTNGAAFKVWLLIAGNPTRANTLRYLFQAGGSSAPTEYRNPLTNGAVLPARGGWEPLPQPALGFPQEVHYLGHRYKRETEPRDVAVLPPTAVRVVGLRTDLLVGPATNKRQKDETRRYDGSDYELIPLTREDYRDLHDAGVTCVAVDAQQWKWADELGLYYWGAAASLPYPELLYNSQYLGPALFLDEPAVGTRDYAVRPRLAKDVAFRKALTPQLMFEEFQKYYDRVLRQGPPLALMKALRARRDIDLGDMSLSQENLYSWETMVSTGAYQLSRDPRVPEAIVFEPPGRIGTRRTLPEMDMTYGVQLPPDDPKALTDIIFGFLRGAARVTGKKWGISIYGAFERADAPWWMTHAYDLGATHFFFWDNYRLACVPFGEVLSLARHLRDYANTHPRDDPRQLRNGAEVAILLPAGYDLGHVQTGKGNMWGLGELNLERLNREGITYRVVMGNFFTEIERCFRLGVPFDLLWDLPGTNLTGYREIVRIREDGKVELRNEGKVVMLDHARVPERATGTPPQLTVKLSSRSAADAVEITARARIQETAAKVYYTYGADDQGVYRNAMVAWEVYGPDEQDQFVLTPNRLRPNVVTDSSGGTVEVNFKLTSPGNYRLRAATVDVAGRTSVVWQPIVIVTDPESGRPILR